MTSDSSHRYERIAYSGTASFLNSDRVIIEVFSRCIEGQGIILLDLLAGSSSIFASFKDKGIVFHCHGSFQEQPACSTMAKGGRAFWTVPVRLSGYLAVLSLDFSPE
jgi:hypothetical protein